MTTPNCLNNECLKVPTLSRNEEKVVADRVLDGNTCMTLRATRSLPLHTNAAKPCVRRRATTCGEHRKHLSSCSGNKRAISHASSANVVDDPVAVLKRSMERCSRVHFNHFPVLQTERQVLRNQVMLRRMRGLRKQ